MKFTERFGIEVSLEETRKRVVNRIYNRFYLDLFEELPWEEQSKISTTGIAGGMRKAPKRGR
jgi:hypothetical protein